MSVSTAGTYQTKTESMRIVVMEKKEREEDMNTKQNSSNQINFTDYAPLDRDYTKEELAAVYKKIIQDISTDTK